MIKRLDYRFFSGGGGGKAREDDSEDSSQSDSDLSDDQSDASRDDEESDSPEESSHEAEGNDTGDSEPSGYDVAELASGERGKGASEKPFQRKPGGTRTPFGASLGETKAIPSEAARARLAEESLKAVAEGTKGAKAMRKKKLELEQERRKRGLDARAPEQSGAERRSTKEPVKGKRKIKGTERPGGAEESTVRGKGGGGGDGVVLRSEDSWKSQWADAVDSDEEGPSDAEREEDAGSDEERDGERWLLMKMGEKGSTFRCRVCPSVICLNEISAAAHLESKKHRAAVKRWKSGTLHVMLNSDGEVEEDGETHAERMDRLSKRTTENVTKKKKKKLKGRQRQRKRQKLKEGKPDA